MRFTSNASVLIGAVFGMLCGCTSVPVVRSEPDRTLIESQYSRLDLTHGVSREDAVTIAQHYMLSKGYDYDWFVASSKKVTDDSKINSWIVEFEPKEDGYGSGPRRRSEIKIQMLMPYWVTIRKDTGEISVVVIRSKSK
jgi:hypothetical protein